MTSRSPRSRLAWGLLALVQLFVVTAAPAADAALESGEPKVVHMETESSTACSIQHDHLYCQLCRVTAVNAPPASAGEPVPFGPVDVAARPLVSGAFSLAEDPGLYLFGPRAPPRA